MIKGSPMHWDRILIATDGSKYSDVAVAKAIDLAKLHGSGITIISVVNVTEELMAQAPAAVEKLVKKAEKIVEVIVKIAAESGIEAEGLVREGEPCKIITEIAKNYDVDIIIMGSHGRTGLSRLLMGSVTERVVRYAECAVLIVKAK